MLFHSKDWRSVAYLVALPVLVYLQWNLESLNFFLFAAIIILAIGVASINHNHGHVPLWKNSILNVITDYWICLLQGVPVFLFEAAHIKSHHAYNQSEKDVTRVSRVGDHNHLLGYIIFPLYVLAPINKLRSDFLAKVRKDDQLRFLMILGQYAILLTLWTLTLWLDWRKAIVYVIVPQLISVHFLLASNYMQHAQTVVGSEYDHSRNFTGFLNVLYFNVGYHTAHHSQPRLHWTELKRAHQAMEAHINPGLNEKSWFVYFLRTMTYRPLRTKLNHIFGEIK